MRTRKRTRARKPRTAEIGTPKRQRGLRWIPDNGGPHHDSVTAAIVAGVILSVAEREREAEADDGMEMGE